MGYIASLGMLTQTNIGMLYHNETTMGIETRAIGLLLKSNCYIILGTVVFNRITYFTNSRNWVKGIKENQTCNYSLQKIPKKKFEPATTALLLQNSGPQHQWQYTSDTVLNQLFS